MQPVDEKMGFILGVNLSVDPRALQPGELAKSKNMAPSVDGLILQKRKACGWHPSSNALTGVAPIAGGPRGLYALNPKTGKPLCLFATAMGAGITAGLVAFDLGNIGQYTAYDTGLDEALLSFRPSAADYRTITNFCLGHDFEGFVDFVPAGPYGVAPSFQRASFVMSGTLVGPTGGGQTQFKAVRPKLSAKYRSRMVYGNLGPGMETWLVFSDWNNPNHNVFDATRAPPYIPMHAVIGSDALAENGAHLPMETLAGEELRAIHEVMLQATGSPVQSAFLCLTEKSAAFVTGEPPQSYESVDYFAYGLAVQKVNYKVGCASRETLSVTPFGLIWASDEDVWCLPTGASPVPIGTKLRPLLKGCPADLQPRWFAVFHEGFYKLAVAKSTVTNTLVSSPVAETEYEFWWLDLRQGIPENAASARWFGPMNYDAICTGSSPQFGPTGTGFAGLYAGTVVGDTFLCPVSQVRQNDTMVSQAGIVDMNGGETVDYAFKPVIAVTAWQPSTLYAVGDLVRPADILQPGDLQTGDGNGHFYVCTTAGTSNAGVPAWDATPGSTTAEVGPSTVVWTEGTNTLYGQPVAYGGQGRSGEVAGVLVDLQTRETDFGDNKTEKVISGVELNARTSAGNQLNVALLQDQGARTETGDVVLENDAVEGFVLGVSTLDSASPLAGQFFARSIAPDVQQRVKVRQVQLQLTDGGGIYIAPDEEEGTLASGLSLVCLQDGVTQIASIDTALTAGLFTLAQLFTALSNAMTAGLADPTFDITGNITLWQLGAGVGGGLPCIFFDVTLGASWAGHSCVWVLQGGANTKSRTLASRLGFDTTVLDAEAPSPSSSGVFGQMSTIVSNAGAKQQFISGAQSQWPTEPGSVAIAAPIQVGGRMFSKRPFNRRNR